MRPPQPAPARRHRPHGARQKKPPLTLPGYDALTDNQPTLYTLAQKKLDHLPAAFDYYIAHRAEALRLLSPPTALPLAGQSPCRGEGKMAKDFD